jgi:hypothetical protein
VPTIVRVRSRIALTSNGTASSNLLVIVRPANDHTITEQVQGCSAFEQLILGPAFENRGVEVIVPTVPAPVVAVFGFTARPQLLSPMFATPCLLIPSPDVALFLPPMQPLRLGLPAALRPLRLWVQGVGLTTRGLSTTGSYQVDAH